MSETAQAVPAYRLFVDETGTHAGSHAVNIGERYLGLLGVYFRMEHHAAFAADLDAMKARHFPRHLPKQRVVLHRRDIIRAEGEFVPLVDPVRRAAFDADLLRLVEAAHYGVVAVVVDKLSHAQKEYRRIKNPYHYGMTALLERYVQVLIAAGATGDVVGEARSKRDDQQLREAYATVAYVGTQYMKITKLNEHLSTKHIKLHTKHDHVAGIELADVLAHTATRDVIARHGGPSEIVGSFAIALQKILFAKYRRNPRTGAAKGWGQVLLD